jgi:hypothetical protein
MDTEVRAQLRTGRVEEPTVMMDQRPPGHASSDELAVAVINDEFATMGAFEEHEVKTRHARNLATALVQER